MDEDHGEVMGSSGDAGNEGSSAVAVAVVAFSAVPAC